MSKNAWLKASIDEHRINNPASAGFFCLIFFRGSLEALCKLQRITSVPQRAALRSAPLVRKQTEKCKSDLQAGPMTSNSFWPGDRKGSKSAKGQHAKNST